ncbi:hypothetical protein LRY65_03520 [Candidatus Woesebacteria bacterium]|nr:hypothetical protein [Candidatus Woesebacteria bacterium]MCD8506963.1 hypothetical protein [Candidatus Woesebacteria bacterium]MCD8527254.1 hypothetical protein [Candidatus Woesebacteria bacterium]MCD8546621.1 hypothetical protein [Candidatus Woesebacteria bacterium]
MNFAEKIRSATLLTVLTFVSVMFVGAVAPVQANQATEIFYTSGPMSMTDYVQPGGTSRIQATVQNMSSRHITTPLCARDVTTGRHLGCVPEVGLSQGESFQFSIPGMYYQEGEHNVRISYRDPEGMWHEVKDYAPVTDRAQVVVY